MLANLIVNITGKRLQALPPHCLETVRGASSPATNQAVESTACYAGLLANFVLRRRAAPCATDRESAASIAGNSSQALPSSDGKSVVPQRCASNRRRLQERVR